MTILPPNRLQQTIDDLYRRESRRVFATLVRLVRDFDLAEEVLQEAFAAALERWGVEGVPENPAAWLVSTGRFKAIDALRRQGRLGRRKQEIAERLETLSRVNAARASGDIEDDRLRLIFACCHPAVEPSVRVALTLREVCGLTTAEIASAFLVAPATMAQRIVRGKAKIRDAGVPFEIPSADEFAERLDSVLTVVYLVFNEGYSASSGESATRADLSGEAIRLGRMVVELCADGEAIGLLALMLLQESRRTARTTRQGDLVLLEDQDRALWDRKAIEEGRALVARALAGGTIGRFAIQAAIAAEHARARSAEATDWSQIVAWYDALSHAQPSPVVELNRAVAVAMRDGPEAGLPLIDAILSRGELVDYHLAHAARADLLRRIGRIEPARSAYEQALQLARQAPERRFLANRLASLLEDSPS